MLDKVADTLKQYLPDAGDAIVDRAMSALHDPASGGLHGIVSKLQSSGLGDTVNSWISKGENLPISAESLKNALGAEHLSELASKFGIEAKDAGERLASLLPTLIDKVTPDGILPGSNS